MIRVLGIETSCDETAAAVVALNDDGSRQILANEVLSQIAAHAPYGGVVPEIAARHHVEALDQIVARALATAKLALKDVDAVAVAAGPGLIGGLIVGVTTAKTLALVAKKPFIAVNHLEAHALTARLTHAVAFPFLLLLASGGHTALVAARDVGDYVRLGSTIDDAIGEAFDKAAKLLGLPYPGGPSVEKAAETGDAERFDLPRPLIGRPGCDFSLSGLKTALRLASERISPLTATDIADLCASFQAAIVDVVDDRTRRGLQAFAQIAGKSSAAKSLSAKPLAAKPSALVVAGGVAANGPLRQVLSRLAAEAGLKFVAPPLELCGDNAAMIAWAGIERLRRGLVDDLTAPARARWPLGEEIERRAPKAAREAAPG
ncbi:N6-L-threonylcarbamoyladenine synthase [Rhizobiales bacterium GAS113]|nr:N6-L-threonylcarbamoyladenine synthase [Rhizobiales bacterium GAS113]